jgi:hypothetical protein
MDGNWLHRYRLIGDEDCGVGIECRDHFDGGRPLAYYDSGTGVYKNDPLVQDVSTIPGLLAAAEVHEHEMHGQPAPQVVNVHIAGSVRTPAELAKAVQDAMRNNNSLRG